MVEVDVIITSMGEPQIERALESLRAQTYPFRRIIHIEGVVPFYQALKRGMEQVEAPWYANVGADAVYDKDALERVIKFMGLYPHEKCCGYCMSLWDSFMEIRAGFLCVQRTEPFRRLMADSELKFDRAWMSKIRAEGWFLRKRPTIVGTHFSGPDEYQVFHRFFILATKDGLRGYEICRDIMRKLYERDNNVLQRVALDALDFGTLKGDYPGSIKGGCPFSLEFPDPFISYVAATIVMLTLLLDRPRRQQ
jgi:glycosyltransferase involved in cell wall biosynthesis